MSSMFLVPPRTEVAAKKPFADDGAERFRPGPRVKHYAKRKPRPDAQSVLAGLSDYEMRLRGGSLSTGRE
jgi:hypothetical protein